MIEVVNRQRQRPLDSERWRKFAERVLQSIGAQPDQATLVFASDRMVKRLNQAYRGRNQATDVLSFPAEQTEFERQAFPHLGDVVISVERAAEQAAQHKLDFEREVSQLILHGLLHLCGYDHETDNGEMNRFELKLRRRLRI